ncbi:MAG: UvrD-helicase domain-containing protein [Myxococcota bacterium]
MNLWSDVVLPLRQQPDIADVTTETPTTDSTDSDHGCTGIDEGGRITVHPTPTADSTDSDHGFTGIDEGGRITVHPTPTADSTDSDHGCTGIDEGGRITVHPTHLLNESVESAVGLCEHGQKVDFPFLIGVHVRQQPDIADVTTEAPSSAAALNAQQRQAVSTCDAPVCVLAAAGTGKTRTIVHRVHHLIRDRGAAPDRIMAVSFTNKAAREMRDRVAVLLPEEAGHLWLGTFHALAARILRRWGDLVGIPPGFLIYDESDVKRLMRQIGEETFGMTLDETKSCLRRIAKWRNQGILPSELGEEAQRDEERQRAAHVYTLYLERLAKMGALDFNGLLTGWQRLLQHPDGKQRLCSRIRHLLVDEYQDTNRVQADIVLCMGHELDTVAVVGDDDQSIYSFRGAIVSNMRQFLEQLPGAKLVRLETNYRSVGRILQAANGVIARNSDRVGKTLRPSKEDGEAVQVVAAMDDRVEAHEVVRRIDQFVQRGYPLNAMAVLLRTNSLSRPFEEALHRARIPYRLVGGMRFYDRREVKDVLATLRAALNPKSDVDFLRALTAVPRGIGAKSLARAQEQARAQSVSLSELSRDEQALRACGITPRAAGGMHQFCRKLDPLRGFAPKAFDEIETPRGALGVASKPLQGGAYDALVAAAEASGVVHRLRQEENEENAERLENVGQLIAAAKQYDQWAQESPEAVPGARGFLESTALLGSGDEGQDAGTPNSVWLMTLHAAKGLEFPVVFMPAMEEHALPHSHALMQGPHSEAVQEERRLAYVGITRAREHLTLLYANRRLIRGTAQGRTPSRFLREIPSECAVGDLPRSFSANGADRIKISSDAEENTAQISSDTTEPSRWNVGARVWHNGFGEGVVASYAGRIGTGGDCVRVQFAIDGKLRTVMTDYLRPM